MPIEILQVFVSSTWLDLQPERQAVETALQRLREIKFNGMEYFGSRDETTRGASLDEVGRSRVYVGLFAGRYGSGITEEEYRRARTAGLPCFIYFKRESDIPPEWREAAPERAAQLVALKDDLRRNHIVTEFTSPEELAAKVTADMHRWLVDEYLTPQLEQAARGQIGREQARDLLAAIKDESDLGAALLSKVRKLIVSSDSGIAVGGNVQGGVLVTGSGNRITFIQDARSELPPELRFGHAAAGEAGLKADSDNAGCAGAIDGPEGTHARFALNIPAKAIIALAPIAALGLYLIFGRNNGCVTLHKDSIYHVRATVTNLQGVPVEDAKVWSSIGGEPKKVAGGWQFDIPAAGKPQDGKLTFFAAQQDAFLTGQAELTLGKDYYPAVTIRLARDTSAKVRGQVTDGKGRAVAGARVFVTGYEAEGVITKDGGNFELPAHAAVDQQVLLVAERAGIGVARIWHPAGDTPAQLVLRRD